MSDETDALVSQDKQRKAAKAEIVGRATLDDLRGKKRVEDDFTVDLNGKKVSFLFRAVGSREYDRIVNDCPATVEQLSRNMAWDEDKVFPILMSKICVEPSLNEDQWAEMWKSPDWSRGELGTLFNKALALVNKGLNPAPTVAD